MCFKLAPTLKAAGQDTFPSTQELGKLETSRKAFFGKKIQLKKPKKGKFF